MLNNSDRMPDSYGGRDEHDGKNGYRQRAKPDGGRSHQYGRRNMGAADQLYRLGGIAGRKRRGVRRRLTRSSIDHCDSKRISTARNSLIAAPVVA